MWKRNFICLRIRRNSFKWAHSKFHKELFSGYSIPQNSEFCCKLFGANAWMAQGSDCTGNSFAMHEVAAVENFAWEARPLFSFEKLSLTQYMKHEHTWIEKVRWNFAWIPHLIQWPWSLIVSSWQCVWWCSGCFGIGARNVVSATFSLLHVAVTAGPTAQLAPILTEPTSC